MGEVRVKGYVNLRLWLQSEDGTWVELLEEAWVLKDLKVPLLLGKDFHVNYHLSNVRDDHRSLATMLLNGWLVMIPAHSAPSEQPGWVGKSEQSKLHAIMVSLRKTGEKSISKPTHPKTLPPLVRAAARVWIPAYTSSLIQVSGPFDLKGEWIVECLLVTTPDVSALCAPSTFIKADGNGMAQIPVANFSPHPHIIQLGEVLGVACNPHSWLDEPSVRVKAEARKMAAFIDKLSQDWGKMKPFLGWEEEEELIRPKTAEVPQSQILPSPNLPTISATSHAPPPTIQSI